MKSKIISTIPIATFSIPLSSVPMSNKARREDTLIRAFGITALAILILVGVAGAAPFAYVTSLGVDTGTVFVIDTATNNVTAVVPVGGWPEELQSTLQEQRYMWRTTGSQHHCLCN